MNQTAAYYNTNHLEGEALAKANDAAMTQEEEVLLLFRKYPNVPFRTHDVEHYMARYNKAINHDSCKRAITNLTKKGLLLKSEKASTLGPFGKNVFTWIYNPNNA